MADASEMTPEELREYAARKEAARLHSSHLPEGERGEPAPWEKRVEVRGREYTVDMRRLKSREFFKMMAALAEKGDAAPASEQIALFDYAFEPIERDIAAHTVELVGYEDFSEYYGICAELFEAVGLKN